RTLQRRCMASAAATGVLASRPFADVADAVTKAAHGFDQVPSGAELRSQPLHVHVDSARLDIRCRLPHVLEQKVSRLYASLSLGEQQQELELGRREIDL